MNNISGEKTLCGKPHRLEIFRPLSLFPIIAGAAYLCARLALGNLSLTELYVTAALSLGLSAIILIIFAGQRARRSWRIEGKILHYTRGVMKSSDMTLRLDRISSSELLENPMYSLFGGTRVRLYSTLSSKAVFSMIMPKEQAVELVNFTAVTLGSCAAKPRRMVQKKYAALLVGVTSRETIVPLGIAAVLCIFGYGNAELYILAAALWLFAAISAVTYTIKECRMSVCHVNMGYAIQTGLRGGHRIFVPDAAIIGMIETRSPIYALCGASKLELLCAGGRKITCVQWYDGGNSEEAARRMIGCVGRRQIDISDSVSVGRRYFRFIAADIAGIAIALGGYVLIPQQAQKIWISAAAVIIFAAAMHSLTAVKCRSDFKISISGSSLRTGGMGMFEAEFLTLLRGEFAAIKLRESLSDRIRGICTVEIIPKGSVHGVKCRCVPNDRIDAFIERIY